MKTKRKENKSSIGVDIESIERFEALDKKDSNRFIAKIFTKKEVQYCFSKKTPAQHMAVRFAAKEAIIKAISSLGKKAPAFNAIDIINDAKGIPSVKLKGYNIKISLAHCGDKAIAFVMVEIE